MNTRNKTKKVLTKKTLIHMKAQRNKHNLKQYRTPVIPNSSTSTPPAVSTNDQRLVWKKLQTVLRHLGIPV